MESNTPVKNNEILIRTLTGYQIEILKELLITTEVTNVGRVDDSGALIVEYFSNQFDVRSELKRVQINRFP